MIQDYSSLYDADYYRTACGPIPYERNEKWLGFFREVARNIVQTVKPAKVLDAGCAMGFLVESLWDLGVEAWGVDISSYALSKVRKDMQPYCRRGSLADPLAGPYDLIACIEVLEHIPPEQTETVIANLAQAGDTILFSSTPFDVAEPTHCNVRPLISWLKLFARHGFRPDLLYDAGFVTQHAVLLRRQQPLWPDEVLALFSRMLYQKTNLVEKLERNAELAAETEKFSARAEALDARLAEAAGERAALGERAAALEQELQERAARLAQLGEENAEAAEELARLREREQTVICQCATLEAELDRAREREMAAAAENRELREQWQAEAAELAHRLETAGRENASLAAAREDLESRLGKAAEELARSRAEGKALAGVVRDLRELYGGASAQLAAITSSPGWQAIERYRAWRQRAIASRRWLRGPYEKAAAVLLRGAGAAAERTPAHELPPAVAPAPPLPVSSAPAGEPPPEIARFALIISGCPGDALRYRSEHQAEELRFLGLTVQTALFDQVDYERVLGQYEMFLLHRVPHTPGIEAFIHKAREMGKPVIFDTDDLIFNEALLGDIKAIRDFNREERELYVSGVRRYHRTLALGSGALVTTEALRDAVRELFPQMPVWINRNAVSDAMVRQAGAALQSVARPADGCVRIAYFSGTRTHQDDFAQCAPALAKLLEKHRQARFLAVGHLDVPEELRRFGERIETRPLVPWQELPSLLRRVDINLAPLEPDNRFTAAKSELKYFEAGLLGVPTAASDVPAYRLAITHGENGFLCRTAAEWEETLEKLALDAKLRERVGTNARADVLRRYTTRSRAPQLAATLGEIFREHGSSAGAPLAVAFVLRAPIAQTGGGYKTIFSLAHYLALRGHDVHLYVEPIAHLEGKSDAEIVDFCRRHFGQSPARIHVGHGAIGPSDIAIATNWPTAYTVNRLDNTRARLYLVQDYEPEFYDKSDPNHDGAERTYDLPLKKVVIGKYLAEVFARRDGLEPPSFPFFLDRAVFSDRGVRAEAPVRILFFARPGMKRRGYELGVEALGRVARACPEARIVFYGMEKAEDTGFRYENLGELPREKVAEEMNRSHIHLSFSLTNISWVPFEAMACGCAVVEAKAPSVEPWMGAEDGNCVLAEPRPEAVAQALIGLVRDPSRRERTARAGERHIASISAGTDETGARFEQILMESVFREAPAGRIAEVAAP